MMIVRLAIRGYGSGALQFEERVDVDAAKLESLIPQLAAKHVEALSAHRLHMIEIEFLDEPNLNQRFYRMGTDPSGMVVPVAVTSGAASKSR